MINSENSAYNAVNEKKAEEGQRVPREQLSKASKVKFFGCIAFLLSLCYAMYYLFSSLNAPEYKLAIANEYIDKNNMKEIEKIASLKLKASKPVYIRFDWSSVEELKTDYLRIGIYSLDSGKREEEASLGRRRPRSAKYIYFMGPLEAGNYLLEVSDREGKILKEKEFEVR